MPNGGIYWDGVSTEAFEIDDVDGPLYSLFLGPDNDPATAPQTRFGYPIADVSPCNMSGASGVSSRCASGAFPAYTLISSSTVGAQFLQDGLISSAWEAAPDLGFPIGQPQDGPSQLAGPSYSIQVFENGIIYVVGTPPGVKIPDFTFAGPEANAFHAQVLLDKVSGLINQAVNNYNTTKLPTDHTIGMEGGPHFTNAGTPIIDYSPGSATTMGAWGSVVQNRRFQLSQQMYVRVDTGDPEFVVSFDVELHLGGHVGFTNAKGDVVDLDGNPIYDINGVKITTSAASSIVATLSNCNAQSPRQRECHKPNKIYL